MLIVIIWKCTKATYFTSNSPPPPLKVYHTANDESALHCTVPALYSSYNPIQWNEVSMETSDINYTNDWITIYKITELQ